MFFAKFPPFLCACLLLTLTGCAMQSNIEDYDRHEAMKARVALALAYFEEGDLIKAKENIDKALLHTPQDYLPHSLLAYYYQQQNEIELAEKTYQHAMALSQKQHAGDNIAPDVLNNYGTFLCQQGKRELAQQQFKQALQSNMAYHHQAQTQANLTQCEPIN